MEESNEEGLKRLMEILRQLSENTNSVGGFNVININDMFKGEANPENETPNFLEKIFGLDPSQRYETKSFISKDGNRITVTSGFTEFNGTNTKNLSVEEQLRLLNKKLEAQVNSEEFEKAAITRDEIIELKKNGSPKTKKDTTPERNIWDL